MSLSLDSEVARLRAAYREAAAGPIMPTGKLVVPTKGSMRVQEEQFRHFKPRFVTRVGQQFLYELGEGRFMWSNYPPHVAGQQWGNF